MYNLFGDCMDFGIERIQNKDGGYLRDFRLSFLEKDNYKSFILTFHPKENITVIRPYNLNTKFQQLSASDVFEVIEQVKQWFPLEFKDFNKKRLKIRLMDSYCREDEYVGDKYKNPDMILLCKLKKNTFTLFKNSHISKQEILAKLERIFIHEMAHIKWSKLSLYKRLQYYLSYKADGGFSLSLHTKGNYNEDFATRTEEFIKFREEFKDVKQVAHRFKFIENLRNDE